MKIRTLNKRRKRLNKYKMIFLSHLNSAIKIKDYLITEAPNFKMYVSYLQNIYESKRYKQFYYEIMRKIDKYKNK